MIDFQDALTQSLTAVEGFLPNLIAAVAILVAGWLVAVIAASLTRRALGRTQIDNRVAGWIAGTDRVETGLVERRAARGVYLLIMLFVLVAFFEVLGLAAVTEPLNGFLVQIFGFAPRILGAAVLLLVAWLLASALRGVVVRALRAARIDRFLEDRTGTGEALVNPRALSEVVFWVTIALFLPAVLGALAVEGLLAPVEGVVARAISFIPNLSAAGLILLFGWLAARFVQRVVTGLVAALGADRLGAEAGLSPMLGQQGLSGLVGLLAYALTLLPVLVAALDALQLGAVAQPASNMLSAVLETLPGLFGAFLMLLIAYLVGRIVAGLVSALLARMGLDGFLARSGVGVTPAGRSPSEVAGTLTLVAIVLFATIEALRTLGLLLAAGLVAQFLVFAAHVLLGLAIFAIGVGLAGLATGSVRASRWPQAGLVALAARTSILVLAGAMALREMGVASEIVTLAFGLLLGAVAVAAALAFGLGCRDLAARELAGWLQSLRAREGNAR